MVPAPNLCSHANIFLWAGHAVYSPQHGRRGEEKHNWIRGKEGYAAAQGNCKWNSEFYKKEALKENSIYSFPPGGGETPYMKGVGMLVANFEFNP